MSYKNLIPLIQKTKSSLSPKEFQEIVNVVFHDIESEHYDALHHDMWGSLFQQIDLLAHDILNKKPQKKLHLLDIGCGTGLSTELLLKTKLGEHIEAVTLLDTSPKMLEQAKLKAQHWDKAMTYENKMLHELKGTFDIILVCSVLHHIPDLSNFLNDIDRVLNPNGFFIHLQDPNGDYLSDPQYKERRETYEATKSVTPKKGLKTLLPKSLKKRINRLLGRKDYIDQVNDILLEKGAIQKRMTADEIWSVTDIHVEQTPYEKEAGISAKFLTQELHNFTNISIRSYCFFGHLKSDLSKEFQIKEDELINTKAINGRNIAAVWQKQ